MNRRFTLLLSPLLLLTSLGAHAGEPREIPTVASFPAGSGEVDIRCPSCLAEHQKQDLLPPLTLTARPAAAGAERVVFVPVILSAGGAAFSFYTTELTLTNKGTTSANLELKYVSFSGGGDGTVPDVLPAGRQKIVPDAIAYLQSLGLSVPSVGAVGTLRVRFSGLASPADGFATARTTTHVTEGRAGLAYAGANTAAISFGASIPDGGPIVSGTFRPTNIGSGDAFPQPAPTPSAAKALSTFNGTDPNGTWSLYAVDDVNGDSGSISNGWCVNVTTTAQASPQAFCTSESIRVPGSGTGASTGAPASSYPSTISVSGLAGTVSRVTVDLRGFSHTYPDDVDVLLAGPGGQNVMLVSDVGGSWDAVSANLTFDDSPPVSFWLCGLKQDSADRSNVAITHPGNPGEGDVVIRVRVYSGAGGGVPVMTLPDETLSPGGFKQYAEILGDAHLTSGYVKVEKVGGTGRFLTYGIVNDQKNSDGSYLPAVEPGAGAGKKSVVLPVIVEAGGFRSELILTNFSTAAKNLTLTYVEDDITGGSATLSLTVAAGEQRIIPDFVQYMRDQNVSGIGPVGTTFAGALFVSVSVGDVQGLVVSARTSGQAAVGRYGLFYTAVPAGGGFTEKAWLFGLQQNAENRTNLALVNTGETDSSTDVFKIELFDGETGAPAGTIEDVTVGARGWLQIGTVLTQVSPTPAHAYARITRTSGGNPFLAYAVVNDGSGPGERSGDGAFVMPEVDCSYSLSGTGKTLGWSGGSASTTLTATSGCTWDAASDASWVTLTSASSGSGGDTISYTVAQNTNAASRSATLTVAGKEYAITQLGNAPGSYDGSWSGTTSQSRPISFTILKNEMTLLGMGISATLYPCSVTATFTDAVITPAPPVVGNTFSTSPLLSVGNGAFVLNLAGTFPTTTTASGTAGVSLIITGGTICFGSGGGVTWSATRQ